MFIFLTNDKLVSRSCDMELLFSFSFCFCVFEIIMMSICEKKISAEVQLIHAEQISI